MINAAPPIFDQFKANYKATKAVEMTVEEYLKGCRNDKSFYANPWERLLKAVGEPVAIDYAKEPNLARIFNNQPMFRYPAFKDFYGMEEAIKKIVAFLRSGAQGGEESKQILYLLGPVGGGKSSLAKRITELMEQEPIYVLKSADGEISPVCDSPLSLFEARRNGEMLRSNFGINPRNLDTVLSPWGVQQLEKYDGDITRFKVVRLFPSISLQLAISRVEAGDKNNQDVSSMVGKVDMSKLEDGLSEHDPGAYGYNGGLNRGHQGLMEFVEMFKAPVTALNPLLAATQDRQFNGTQPIGAMPFKGIILAHSNESEWEKFRNDKTNEAFIDRVFTIKVPYTLRYDEELKIYQKRVQGSALVEAPCAPHTLEMLAKYAVMTRLFQPAQNPPPLDVEMKVYNGERVTDPKAKTLDDYRKAAYEAGFPEGMSGASTRNGFKLLAETFNLNAETDLSPSALPIDLMFLLEKQIKGSDLPVEERNKRLTILKTIVAPEYAKALDKEIKEASLESAQDYAQNIFENYIKYAEWSLEDEDGFIDPDTKNTIDREAVEKHLQAIEKPAAIVNAKDFRGELIRFVQKSKLNNSGKMPDWKDFTKFREVIEKTIAASTQDLMKMISFDKKPDAESTKKHEDFVTRLETRGYTPPQVRRVVMWYQANKPA
jgi:serine protein kinase